MRRLREGARALTSWALLAVASAGCLSIESRTEEPGARARILLEEYYQLLAGALCERLVSCCSEEEEAYLRERNLYGSSQPWCIEYVETSYTSELVAARQRLASGELTFDETRTEDCLAALRGCTDLSACYEVFSGPKPDGSTCTDHADCATGKCWSEQCGGPADFGELCRFNSDCAMGLYCPDSTLTCAPSKSAGEPCLLSTECVSRLCLLDEGRCADGAPPDSSTPEDIWQCQG